MSLHLHRAERADHLVDALAGLLSQPLVDPFATEIVAVPMPGVERWLSQRLSGRLGTSPDRSDGVCAGVGFPSPRRLVAQVLESTSPGEGDHDPWRPQRAVWPLLRVIDGCRGEVWASVLWSYLGVRAGATDDAVRGGRRWSTAHHLAGLYARYAATRPTMVRRWRQGLDVDADGKPLPADRAWQAELWRRLRAELATPGPAERIDAALTAVAAGAEVDLPERLSVFGATRFDPDHLRMLGALATQRDVHLWLPHPSPELWRAITTELAGSSPPRRRSEDHTEDRVDHRLLAYLGRDARELQLTLAAAGPAHDQHHPAPDRPDTLLGWLQADLAANAGPRPSAERPVLAGHDRSVSVHASHGPDRQVEVLRELLVGLLADDPTLEPRDVIVMCPDIETFAPVIAASFGLDTADREAEHPGHRLRVRLADRSLRQTNPLLAIVTRLLSLAESRMQASTLLDLCATPPVARKFGFRPDDLERLHDLVVGSGVRWGLDAHHRARYGMGGFTQNTWAAGLERMLLGVTMDETDNHFIGTTLPLDDVDSADVDLVGRLAECVGRVRDITDACGVPRSLDGWVELFTRAIDLLTAVPAADHWQVAHAYAELGRLADDAAPPNPAGADDGTELSLAEVSALLAETFRGRPTRANFRTGTLTMCTMMPMRSVPHRVVCLLGVDDGVFPRSTRLDGDDITELDEWVGDRNTRSEDRQLLLDAIMAAQEQLVIIYAGMDPRSGKPTAPAVPIGELLNALDVTAVGPEGRTVSDTVTVVHPLQPFDERNFTPGELVGAGTAFSFDRAALRGVRAATRARPVPDPSARPPVVLTPLDPAWTPTLADLLRFLAHPLRALLRDRAGLSTWRDDEGDEQIPVSVDGLERWKIGDRLLRQHLLGQSLDGLGAAEWRRGSLPPRVFGARVLDGVSGGVAELATAASPHLTGGPERYDVVVDLGAEPGGDRLTGSVGQVYGDCIVRVSFSRLSAKARLQSWVELLALTAAHPDRDWRAVTIGSGGRSILGPVPSRWANLVLTDLVDLQRTGLREPVPFAPKTSAEYAVRRWKGRPIEPYLPLLEKTWLKERDETYEQFFGAGVTVAELLAQPVRPEEVRGALGEPSRFGTLARRVFHLLLDSEELS